MSVFKRLSISGIVGVLTILMISPLTIAQDNEQVQAVPITSGDSFRILDWVTDVTDLEDGQKRYRVYDTPRLLYQENGELKKRPTGWNFYNEQAVSKLKASQSGYQYEFPFESESSTVSIGAMEQEKNGTTTEPSNGNFSQAQVNNATISTYQNVYPNVDIVFDDTKWWRSKSIVLNQVPQNISADDHLVFWEHYTLPSGAKVMIGNEEVKDGSILKNQSIDMVTPAGERLNIGSAILFDSSGENRALQKEFNSETVEQIVNTKNGQLSIGLKVPTNYLLDSNRVYPVEIDPTFYQCQTLVNPTYEFAPCSIFTNYYLRATNGGPNANGSAVFSSALYAGSHLSNGNYYSYHPVLYFDAPFSSIANGGQVTGARLKMYHLNFNLGTASNSRIEAKRINQLWLYNDQSFIEQNYDYNRFRTRITRENPSVLVNASNSGWKTLDVTNSVQAWESGVANHGLLIEQDDAWPSGSTPPSGWEDVALYFESSRHPSNDDPYLEIDITYPAIADLTNGGISMNGTNFYAGDTIFGNIIVDNIGNAGSAGGIVNVFFNQGNRDFTNLSNRISQLNYSGIPAGGSVVLPYSYQIPNSANAGNYEFYWDIDATDLTIEGLENNNRFNVTPRTVQPYIDVQINPLQVNGVSYNSGDTINIPVGGTLNIGATVINSSVATAPASAGELRYFFSPNGPTASPTYQFDVDNYVLLAPGQNSNRSTTYNVPNTAGTYYLSFFVDATNTSNEGPRESNNQVYLIVNATNSISADLSVNNVQITNHVFQQYPGNNMTITMNTSNSGPSNATGIVPTFELVDGNGNRYALSTTATSFSQNSGTNVSRSFTVNIPVTTPLYKIYHIEASLSSPTVNDSNPANDTASTTQQIRVEPLNFGGGSSGGNPAPTPPNSCTKNGQLDTDCDNFSDLEEKSGGTPPDSNTQSVSLYDANYDNNIANANDHQMQNYGADPVNLRTGAFEFTQTDFELPGRGIPIKFNRTYNSTTDDIVNRLGNGWNFSYNIYAALEPNGNNVLVNFGGRMGVLFTYNATTQSYDAPDGVYDTLTRNTANNTYVYRTQEGIEYRFNYVLSPSMAILQEIADTNGNITQFGYLVRRDVPLLNTVTDASGRALNIGYGLNTDPNEWDKIVSLSESINPIANERRTVNYTYDANGDLRTVVTNRAYQGTVETFTRSFTYDSNHRMLTYTDARGTVLRNVYDSQGRVIEQYEHNPRVDAAGIDRLVYALAYSGADPQVNGSTHCTTVTTYRDAGSPATTYTNRECYNARELVIRKANGLEQATLYGYDSNGLVNQITDPNGNVTSYTYDNRRRKDTETLPNINGLQTVINYQYENNFNRLDLKTETVTDTSNGNTVATRQWDYGIDGSNGNLQSILDPRGNTESFTYFTNGNRQTHTDKRGNITSFGYDTNGNYLTSQSIQVTDARGAIQTIGQSYLYDVYGNRTSYTDGRNNTTTYAYDTHGNLRLITDALNNQTSYTYDEEGHRLSETDANNHTTRWVYDTDISASLLSETREGDPNTATDDITINYTYDFVGNLISESHPKLGNNFLTTYSYDAANRVTQKSDPLGSMNYTYDANGNKTSETGAQTIDYYYNARNQQTEMREYPNEEACRPNCTPSQYVSHQSIHDGLGRVVEEVDGNNNHTYFTYDLNDNLLTFTDGEGNITTYTYDANNNQISRLNPRARADINLRNANGHSSTYFYDELNRPIREVNAANFGSLTLYDGNGNVREFVDRQTNATTNNTHVITYQYDLLNRRTHETDAYGNSTVTTYDAVGNVRTVKNKENNTVSYTYDHFDRVETMRDQAGLGEDYFYDKAGDLIRKLLADNTDVDYTYDGRHRLKTITDQTGHQKSYFYNNANLKTDHFDGYTTWLYNYDGMNRLTGESTDSGTATLSTNYTYDGNSNKVSVSNSFTNSTFDGNNNLLTRTYINGHTESFMYDPDQNVQQETTGDGDTISYTYDRLNRLQTKSFGTGQVIYTYDNWGNPLTINHPTHQNSYTYDLLNRALTEQHNFMKVNGDNKNVTTAGIQATIQKQYNKIGQLKQLTDAGGRVFDYNYTNRNLLDTVQYSNTILADYDYSQVGKVSQITYGNGVIQIHNFDRLNRIDDLFIQNSTAQLRQQEYQYDSMSRRSALVDHPRWQPSQMYLYQYDAIGELTQILQPNRISYNANSGPAPSTQTLDYTYDNLGNRTTEVQIGMTIGYQYTNQELTQKIQNGRQAINYTYDGNGSLTQENYDRLGTIVRNIDYTYDEENNMRTLQHTWYGELPYGANYQEWAVYYLYDAMGNRTMKFQDGNRQDGWHYDFYVNDGHRVINEYGGINNGAFTLTKSLVYGIDQIAQIDANGAIEYVHSDPLGSMLVMTDANGNDIQQMEYEPFGKVKGASGNADNNYQFTGQEYDPESELSYMNARYYHPGLGRFLQKDPIVGYEGNLLSWNPYIYANNSPMKYTDPTGMFNEDEADATDYLLEQLKKVSKSYSTIIPNESKWGTVAGITTAASSDFRYWARDIGLPLLSNKELDQFPSWFWVRIGGEGFLAGQLMEDFTGGQYDLKRIKPILNNGCDGMSRSCPPEYRKNTLVGGGTKGLETVYIAGNPTPFDALGNILFGYAGAAGGMDETRLKMLAGIGNLEQWKEGELSKYLAEYKGQEMNEYQLTSFIKYKNDLINLSGQFEGKYPYTYETYFDSPTDARYISIGYDLYQYNIFGNNNEQIAKAKIKATFNNN